MHTNILIKQFADSAGKKGGEFYTPSEVVWLLVSLLKPTAGMKIYDPTAGSGGMLIQTRNYLMNKARTQEPVSVWSGDEPEYMGNLQDEYVLAWCFNADIVKVTL